MVDALDAQTEEQILERIVRNKMAADELLAENEQLKAFFKERPDEYVAGSKKEVGKFYIRVTKQTRIDDALARKELSPKEYGWVKKEVVDSAKAKRYLAADVYEKISKKYDNRIEVGLN